MHSKQNPALYYPQGKVPQQVMSMYSNQQSGKSTAPSSGYTTPLKNHHY